MSTLRVEGIRKAYGGLRVLDGVSLAGQSGTVTAIIGPNGAGKSTLANVISGLVTPEAGRIELDGVDVTRLPAYRRARLGIGRTFQNLQLFSGMTVRENVRLGTFRARRSRAEQRAAVDAAMAELGLEALADTDVDSLGFAGAKLVEPARVLAMDPVVLVMDEPAAGLGGDGVTHLTSRIVGHAKAGVGVILIEHNMRLVMSIADYIYVLDHGVLIAEGKPAEIRSNERVLEAYLGHEDHLAVEVSR